MKKILLVILISIVNLYGLDEVSSLPSSDKKLLNKIITTLNLPNNLSSTKKDKIYKKMSFALKDDWSVRWTSNASNAKSKIEKSSTQIADLMIYNNERITNITFIYFKSEKQLFILSKEFIVAKSSLVMDKFKEKKADSKYEKRAESDNYAYFNEKGYTSYEAVFIDTPVGMVTYESSTLLDID